jgi:hypothetical protein
LTLVCETYNRECVVEEDFAECKVETMDICDDQENCPKLPKTKCTIVKKKVTKEFPESQVCFVPSIGFSLNVLLYL